MRKNGDEMSVLTDLQLATLRLFFGLPESTGFLLAGGAALVAQELSTRPTHDLDFFASPGMGSVASARDALTKAATGRGWTVEPIQDAETFCRLRISGLNETLIVDLAVDAPPNHHTISTELGPSYAPEELAGRKTIALFDRAEARDFVDVYALAQRFGRETLLARAAEFDAGFDLAIFASMLRTLERFGDDEIPVDGTSVESLRNYFKEWATGLGESSA